MAGQPRSRGREAAQARATGSAPAPVEGGSNVPAVRQADPRAATIRSLFDRMAPEMERALPRHMTVDRMIRVALTVVQENEDLLKCDPRSLLGALMTCTQVGLEPGPQGHVYFLPFWNRDARQFLVTFVLGYKGIIELARRSGLLLSVSAHTVYQNELDQGRFSVEYGTSPGLHHKPIVFGERGDPVGYYATAKLANPTGRVGAEDVFVVLTRAEVEVFRARSATQKAERPSGPWNTDYEAMAWKTCVRRLERWLPQSPELAAALSHEDTVRTTLTGNVTESAEPRPAEPFEVPVGGAVGELAQTPARPVDPPEQTPPQSEQTPPEDGPHGQPPAGVDPDTGEWAEPPLPEPGGPDDPWAQDGRRG